ncbi:MAG TPA: alpha/beta fold hydrolase [Rhizomicrobium sp.]|nr:alpha/beta fold hydrolase [Rhizomicrobium sp.]
MEREERLTAIWRAALQRDTVDIDDDFFDLGGDSLMAVGLFLEIERAFGIKLPVTAIYDAPTIAGQLAMIEAESAPGFSHLVRLKDGNERAPFFIVHGVGGTVMEFAALGRLLETERAVYAVQARGLDGADAPLDRIEHMAALYVDILRARQPDGPYYIGGYSFGGVVAMEMARLLGPENVARLVMIDAFAHPHTWPLKSKAKVRARKLLSRARAFARRPVHEARGFIQRRTTDRATLVNNWLGAVDPNLPLPLRQTRIAGDAALIAYSPKPYRGRADFIRAARTGTVFPSDARNVYGKLIADFVLQTTQGDHRSILNEHAAELAKRVDALLSAPPRRAAIVPQPIFVPVAVQ